MIRAEELKQSSSLSALEALEAPSTSVEDPDDRGHRAAVTTQHQQTVRPRPLGDALRDASTAATSSGASAAGGPGRGPAPSGGAGAYSKEEIQVLRYVIVRVACYPSARFLLSVWGHILATNMHIMLS